MGRVSKRSVDSKLQVQIDEQLSFFIKSLSDKEDVDTFTNEFLTYEEKFMLGKRLLLFMLLDKGTTNTHIHNSLGMSYETIRWYKTIFTTKPLKFKKLVKKMVQREKSKALWKNIDKLLRPLNLMLDAKSNMRSRAKLINRDY